jgi:hypothetical protein
MAGHSRPKGRRAFARLCPGHPRLLFARPLRRGCHRKSGLLDFRINDLGASRVNPTCADKRGHDGREAVRFIRHGRACPGHPRLRICTAFKTWMPATGAGMTAERQCTRRTRKCDERPSFVMAGHSRPKGRRVFTRLCPGHPRLLFARPLRRGCHRKSGLPDFRINDLGASWVNPTCADKRGHDDGEAVHEENQEVRRETLIRHGRA